MSIIANKQFVSARSKVELTAVDNKAGVEGIIYHFDNQEKSEYVSVLDQDLTEGKHFLYYSAADNVGNISMYESLPVYVDQTAPSLSLITEGPKLSRNDTLFVHTSSTLKISAFDKGKNSIRYSKQIL